LVQKGEASIVDVRNQSEWDESHIPGAQHIMLGYLAEQAETLPADQAIIVQCQTGSRSAIGASILQSKGFPAVYNLMGGIRDWQLAGLPATDGQILNSD